MAEENGIVGSVQVLYEYSVCVTREMQTGSFCKSWWLFLGFFFVKWW